MAAIKFPLHPLQTTDRKRKKMSDRKTLFSNCRKYRYSLWRECDMTNSSYAMFIGLNPSTADEVNDDPTIRRCIRFAKDWGYGALCMTNLFAFRATLPDEMKAAADPIGLYNDEILVDLSRNASVVVAAWGVHGEHRNRDDFVKHLIPLMCCLGHTKHGHPKHPLYLKADSQLIPL
jgi:hypothetical protein